ncbi:MAG TPA: SDR family NAD(P)-dependent oxidoreductase [Chitinophagaceae bacterium]|nr:SDR family NAD(P)-dependent oxidoreductase [Chitinophagaceae bacterium]
MPASPEKYPFHHPLDSFLFPVRTVNLKKLAAAVSNKTILITGASFGIGAELAIRLSHYPVKLILLARTKEKLEEIRSQCVDKATVLVYSIDLREESAVNELLLELKTKGINIDILISNAGHSIYRKLLDSTERFHDTKRSSAINFTGPVQLLLGLLPGLIEQKGIVVNVSTVSLFLPHTAGWSAYHSSKAAFDHWLRCAEPEMKSASVSLCQVYLPLVRTRMSMIVEQNHKRPAMSCAKAADAILHSIIRRRRKYRPWCIAIPRFLDILAPNLWYRLQWRRLKK